MINTSGVLVGVASHFNPDAPDTKQRWAPLGLSSDFLWDALGRPHTFSITDQRRETAVYGRDYVRINDRARVVLPGQPNIGRRIVAGGYSRVGVDAFVGNVFARSTIEVADRGSALSVQTSERVYLGPGANVGSVVQGEWMRFEDFSLTVPFPAGSTPLQVVEDGQIRTLAAGPQGKWAVRRRGTLRLSQPGVYIFSELTLDSNATIQAFTTPVWIYVMSPIVHMHGRLLSSGARVLVGAPNAGVVSILGEFQATLVAPNAAVHADMAAGAKLLGSFFVTRFELHQGRFLEHVPFADASGMLLPWVPTCPPGAFTPCS